MNKTLSLAAIIFIFLINAPFTLSGYVQNPYVAAETWQDLQPYFLPEDHPIKPELDILFSQAKTTTTLKDLKKVRFKPVSRLSEAHAIVAKHSKIKGYLIKIFTDDQLIGGEWIDWKKRIIGANYVRQAIERNGYQNLFKVPHKWIYPLPAAEAEGPRIRKHFILIVEDMKIMKNERNHLFWRSIAMTPQRIDALYKMLQDEGLFDSIFPDNIPFCKDGSQAFVDTQHYHQWPVDFQRLTRRFSPKMQMRWNKLIEKGGP